MHVRDISLLGVLSVGMSLTACQTTEPLEGAGIGYHLPRTDAKVSLALTLRRCSELRVDGKDAIDAELTVQPAAGAQLAWYRLEGSDLASSRIKRDLELVVDDNSVISSVNTVNTEVTPDTIVTVAKTAALVVAAAAAPAALDAMPAPPPLIRCLKSVSDAAERVPVLRRAIGRLATQVTDGTAPAGSEDRMSALAEELGVLEAGILYLGVNGSMSLDAMDSAGAVELDASAFDKWFGPADDLEARKSQIQTLFGLSWALTPVTPPLLPMPIPPTKAKGKRSCGLAMAVPQTSQAALAVKSNGVVMPALQAGRKLTGAQWSAPGRLCLDAGFGESRTVKLAFDKFGRTTSFGWSSSAGATSATTLAAGLAEQGSAIYGTVDGLALAAQKAEVDRLTTFQTLAKLKACQALLEAGQTCPKE